MASNLQMWNVEVFGNIFYQKKGLIARIAGIQRALDKQIRLGLLKSEFKLKKELDYVLKEEETLWFQSQGRSGLLRGIEILNISTQIL